MFTLKRYISTDKGTLGQLLDESGQFLCYTCEKPWLNNSPKTSCIPTGTYDCIPHDSAAHPDTWEITNVPNRSAILIHNGNTDVDSEGCILVGDSTGVMNGLPAVLNSVKTLDMLRDTLPDTFTLMIK